VNRPTGAAVCVVGIVPPSARHRGRRRAGRHLDEVVALEEDARTDLHRRVALDRQALVLELHRHERAGLALAEALDLLDLADVDAGDRTGEPFLMSLAVLNAPWISYLSRTGWPS
jgi:hypothetical protein